MTLKDLRHDLADHLALGIGAAATPVGAKVNPPAVIVQSGDPYITASTYCDDSILFSATIISKPGDPPAVADALDDFIDAVRSTLRQPSGNNNRFGFREISGFTTYGEDFPAVVVTVGIDRIAP